MAGRYYAATPIGAGMQNIAAAISGLPAKDAQTALLAQRRDLVAEQILTQGATRAKLEEEAAGLRQQNLGVAYLADRLRQGATTGGGGPDADPAPSPDPVPSLGGGASLAPDAPSVANAFTVPTPITAGGGGGGAPPVALTRPGAAPVRPDVAGAVAPRTGIDPRFNRDVHADAVLAKREKDFPDLYRSYVGGNLGATEADPDKAFSYVQGGAGQSYDSTFTGGQAKQEQTVKRDEAASADRRYATDRREATALRGQNMTDSRVRSGAGRRGSGKDPHPDLKRTDISWINKQVGDYAKGKGFSITPDEQAAVRQRVQELYEEGETLEDALDLAHGEAYETTPEHEVPGKLWGTNTVPEKTEFKRPAAKPPGKSAAAGAPAKPGAKPAAPAAPADNTAKVAELRKKAKANGWSDKQIDDKLKAAGY